MTNTNLHTSPDSINSCTLLDASTTLSNLQELTEQELLALQRWCANLPIDSDVRSRLAAIVEQVSHLRLKH
jgi:hypothetical protein